MRQLKQREKQRGGEDKEGDLLASSNLVAAAADKVDDEVGGGGTNEANQQLLHERNAIDMYSATMTTTMDDSIFMYDKNTTINQHCNQ